MAKADDEGLKLLLKPFHQRAADAEDRLSRLEAQLSRKNGFSKPADEECDKKVKELELKLEEMAVELATEREKVAKLTTELDKKNYRIVHLLRAVKETNPK